ncbi:MAG: pacearchaeosortase [Nanoarchaeota archaeon]
MRKLRNLKPARLLLRVILLLGLVISLPLIYKILTPITIYFTAFLLKLFYQVSINKDILFINLKTMIEISPACVAGSAFLLLLILNLSTPMKVKTRIYSIFFSIVLLFLINILRIVVLSVLLVNNFEFFDLTHKLVWYGLSTIFVIGIWFLSVKLFKIKDIPVYTDIKYLIKNVKKR